MPDINPEAARQRIAQLQQEIARSASIELPPSTSQVVTLLVQHLASRRSRALPPLLLRAAYSVASSSEHAIASLWSTETSAPPDSIALSLDSRDFGRSVYEMKQKLVTLDDLGRAVQKLHGRDRVDHYVFVTTERIDPTVADTAATLYDATGGTEFAVVDCLGFLRHFLLLFHRRRAEFLESYQSLLLDQPDSAVGLPLKEAFLALRRATFTPE